MLYKFDPIYFNGTIFLLGSWEMGMGFSEYERNNLPIPESFFPKSLTFDDASAPLPDMFHASRGLIVLSERARLVIEHWAPGQVEFIPVALQAPPAVAQRLNFDSAYYFINVLGRAQRFQWRETPTHKSSYPKGGTELFFPLPGISKWKLRGRSPEEPMIWHDTPWIDGNKRYSGQGNIFVEGVLWDALEAEFPDQLNVLRVGE